MPLSQEIFYKPTIFKKLVGLAQQNPPQENVFVLNLMAFLLRKGMHAPTLRVERLMTFLT